MSGEQLQDALRKALKFGRRKSDELSPESAPLVLIAHREPEAAEALAEIVLATGMRVFRSAGGEELLAALRDERPSALIVDLGLPGLSGKEVVEALGSGGLSPSAPFLLLAAQDLLSGGGEGRAGTGDGTSAKEAEASPHGLMDRLLRVIQEEGLLREGEADQETAGAPAGREG